MDRVLGQAGIIIEGDLPIQVAVSTGSTALLTFIYTSKFFTLTILMLLACRSFGGL